MANTSKYRIDILSIILSSLLNYSVVTGAENNCIKENSCSCKFSNGSIIDLSSIAPSKGEAWSGKPTNDQDKSEYFYNPCHEFREGNESGACSKVLVCQKQGNNYFALGNAQNVIFRYNDDMKILQLIYYSNTRSTNVSLVCSNEPTKLVVEGETDPGKSEHYLMTLFSICACPDGCLSSESADGLSTGSVLIILLFVFSSIYFLGGMAYLRIVRGASGFEMIPHYEFWLDFPLLVRDGVVFALGGCRAETTYERI